METQWHPKNDIVGQIYLDHTETIDCNLHALHKEFLSFLQVMDAI
jgi:hypothetical protein